MFYNNIYIRDFGIFNNQKLNNLSSNLVVIGGKNRAGKSTFLKLLRYLPFGLPRDNSIPPAKNEYYIEAELEKESKIYNLFLNGFSTPKVLDKNKNHYSVSELFNNLDQLTYQQLFTISLNELQLLKNITRAKKEEKRIFSILLGAGMSELVKVPEIADKYLNKAQAIGGVLGDPSVAAFKPYYKEIKAGEKMRDQALLEIKEFNKKRSKLEENEQKLEKTKQKINTKEYRYLLLDLLKNNYSTLEESEKLKLKINKLLVDSTLEKPKETNDFKSSELEVKINKLLDFMNKNGKKIEIYQQKKSLLRERAENYKVNQDKLKNNYQLLISDLENLNSSWKSPLKELKKIEFDSIKENKLTKNLREYEELQKNVENLKNEIDNLKIDRKELETELNGLEYKVPKVVLRNSFILIFSSLLFLTSSFFINYSQLKYFSLILALAAYINYSSKYNNSQLKQEKSKNLKKDKKLINRKIYDLNDKLNKRTNNLKELEKKLKNYAQLLGFKEITDFSILINYMREIKDKKRRYKDLRLEEEENKKRKEKLEAELKNILALINKAAQEFRLKSNSELNSEQNLIANLEKLFQDLDLICNLKNLISDYKNKKTQLNYSLNASEKNKEALTAEKESQNYYQAFVDLYHDFSSENAVKNKKEEIAADLKSLKKQKTALEEKITTLKNEIQKLSSSKKIEQAQQKINEAQSDLEKKAYNYAVNKSVYFILKKLRQQMIEKAEKDLLEPASEILSKISSKHYKKLITDTELEKTDFKAVESKTNKAKSVKKLSQGSLEQLFLAVRISRIREIKPALPLVLDDSLVNFDSKHLYNTAEIISALAQQQQIFILSCHPKLISYLSNINDSAQYWKLEAGNFSLTDQQKLIEHLSI